MRHFLPWILSGFFLVFTACGDGEHDSAQATCEEDTSLPQRIQIYDSTLRGLLLNEACASCHGGRGAADPYPYLSSDLSTAYQTARTLVHFPDVSGSRFIAKISSGHNCGSSSACETLKGKVLTALGDWRDQEAGIPSTTCSGREKISLPVKSISPGDLKVGATSPLRWDIGATAFGQVAFELQLSLIIAPQGDSPGAYRLSRPILAASAKRLKLSEISFALDEKPLETALNFISTEFVVEPASYDFSAQIWNFPVLSTATQLIPVSSSGHSLGVQFYLEESTDSPSIPLVTNRCQSPELFATVLNGILLAPDATAGGQAKCARCHAVDGSNAFRAFPMGGGTDVCLEALLRSDKTNPSQSLIILKPNVPLPGHPLRVPLSTAEQRLITDWIAAER